MYKVTSLSPTPGTTKQEPETVEQLIRRAHVNLAATNRPASPSRVTKVIRRYVRAHGIAFAASVVDDLAKIDLPSTAEQLWYDIATINNEHVGVEIPRGYAAMRPLSRMRLGVTGDV